MKKIGLLAMALVLALGGLGIGYAAWTDTITIDGTVNTGSVNLEVALLSSTYVYKPEDTHDIKVVHEVTDVGTGDVVWQAINDLVQDPPMTIPGEWELIASAVATSPAEDTVTFTYWNLFPSVDFMADVLLLYTGSIPVRVNDIDWSFEVTDGGDDWITPLINQYPGIVGLAHRWEPLPPYDLGEVVEEGTQLHNGDWVLIWLTIHLPQDNDLMNKSGSITGTVEVIQWNEYKP